MKRFTFLLLVSLFAISTQAQKVPNVMFIANDSISGQKPRLFSRLIIITDRHFNYPKPVDILVDSVISSFGFFETEVFDTTKNAFVQATLRVHQDKIINYFEKDAIHSTNSLNLSISYLPIAVFEKGRIYRARIKVLFSNYNNELIDVYSNWSYFYFR